MRITIFDLNSHFKSYNMLLFSFESSLAVPFPRNELGVLEFQGSD